MSHKRTIAIIEEIGLDFDKPVRDWCCEIFEHCLQVSKTVVSLIYMLCLGNNLP